jgi:hypothetical protein
MKTIAVDFDGVIHRYRDGWQGGEIYDDMMPGCFEAIGKLKDKGYRVVVFTSRKNLVPVRDWLENHFDYPLEVTNEKPPAIAYIDDRGIRFTNWTDILNYF